MPSDPRFEGKPVVPFEDLERHCPPQENHFFAPMSPHGMNRIREGIYRQGKERGCRFISYVSSRATFFAGTPVGENCFIVEDNTIQPFTRIGDNVILWSGNHIVHHSVIHDHVMFSSHVVLSGHSTVEPYCFLGVNATIRDGLRLGVGTLVAMSPCVRRDTEWNPQVTDSYRLAIGLAVSEDGGRTYRRYSAGPLLDRDRDEPFCNTAPCVVRDGEQCADVVCLLHRMG
jgi:hypothetical protein